MNQHFTEEETHNHRDTNSLIQGDTATTMECQPKHHRSINNTLPSKFLGNDHHH